MTLIFNLFYNIFLILFILGEVILISLIVYQIELKRRVLFSTLLTLSVNTIPEEETDYIFNSSSDEIEDDLSQISFNSISEDKINNYSANQEEKFFISNDSKLNLRLDLMSSNEAPSSDSSILVEAVKNIGVQTQLSDFEKVVYSNIAEDIRAKADLLEFGTEPNISVESRELLSKGVQTKPDLHIDLSSTSFDIGKDITAKSILDILPQHVDPLMLEAYLPAPELIMTGYSLAFAHGCYC